MNSKHTPSSSDFKFQLNPNAKEFVPASSRSRVGGSARPRPRPPRRQGPGPLVIKDQKSDEAFNQKLKESRDFWELEEIPSYIYKKHKCATCKLHTLHRQPKNFNKLLKELTHDVVNFVAYYHDCEDKDEEYECKYCVDEFNGVKDEEAERYACPSECECDYCYGIVGFDSEEDYSYDDCDDEEEDKNDEDPEERRERIKLKRKREKAYKKRNQREHMKHLKDEHEKTLKIILYFKQNIIPLCENGFMGGGKCEWGLDDVLRCMDLNKGHKLLHMEEPPRPESPRSPKAWQYHLGMENDDYDMYNYENDWDSNFMF